MIALNLSPAGLRLRRAAVLVPAAATVGVAGWLGVSIAAANGFSPLELVALPLLLACFAWVALSAWTAVAGFMLAVTDRHPVSLRREDSLADVGVPSKRVAILLPIYNEDVGPFYDRLRRMVASLVATGCADRFDFFVLSDTRDPQVQAAEEHGWHALVAERAGGPGVYYRQRADNAGRKAGNISDWVRNWGGGYESMIVLDADSVMAGETMVGLAALMERHPRAGIIQTFSVIVGQRTFFGRVLQFAHRLYGPVLALGAAFWHGPDANYFGHNAILRVGAFAAHCGLPKLSGPPPFGGDVLSHDFVEAACMRRGGWEVWSLPDIGGSFEEMPADLLSFAGRDRRWVQGNLQHLRILGAAGFTAMSRFHLITGALAYAMSMVWLLMLIAATGIALERALMTHQFFPEGPSLFPVWPVARNAEIRLLLGLSLLGLFMPRLLGLAATLLSRARRRGFGGAWRVTAGALIESVTTTAAAPSLMLFHASFVLAITAGRAVGWEAQPRGATSVSWSAAIRACAPQAWVGAGWLILVSLAAPDFLGWIAPVVAGLLLVVPFVVLSSRAGTAGFLRNHGVLTIPEEQHAAMPGSESGIVAPAWRDAPLA